MAKGQEIEEGTTGGQFAAFILEQWFSTSADGREVRCNGAAEQYDVNKYKAYVVNLMHIWKQLAPKMENRSMKKYSWLSNKADASPPGFFYFAKYEADEGKLIEIKDNTTRLEELTKLEKTIRYTLEELGITVWD